MADKPQITAGSVVSVIIALVMIAYIISPIDFIPDIIPVIGWVDDMVAFVILMGVILSALN